MVIHFVKQAVVILHVVMMTFILRELNDSYAEDLNIKMLPGWKDPWGDR